MESKEGIVAIPTFQNAQESISILSKVKESADDCSWVRAKAAQVFEYSGGDRPFDTKSEEYIRKQNQLRHSDVSGSLLIALKSMVNINKLDIATKTNQWKEDLVVAVSLLLRTLRNIIRDSDECTKLVQSTDVLEIIVNTLGSFENNPQIIRDSLAVLANFCVVPENRYPILNQCTKTLIYSINNHSTDISVVEIASIFLMNLSNDSVHLEEIGKNFLPTLVEITKMHIKATTVAENFQTTVAFLSRNHVNISGFLADGNTIMVDLVINLMKLHNKNLIVNEQGLQTLSTLALRPDNKSLLIQCGVLGVLESCFQKLSSSEQVTLWACKAVRSLSHNDQPTKAVLFDVGGAVWVLNAIRTHGTNSEVVSAGAAAIWSLANYPPNKIPFIFSNSADVVIINAMRLNYDSFEVAFKGTATLASLAIEKQNKKRMMKNGVVTAIVASMKAHISNPFVCELGCTCLWSLCLDREVLEAFIQDIHSIQAIFEAMTKHTERKRVLLKSIGALETISADSRSSDNLVSVGAIPILSSLIKMYLDSDVEIIQRSCVILSNIARFNQDLSIFEKYGVAEIAIDVQIMHPNDHCNKAAERLLTSLEGNSLAPI